MNKEEILILAGSIGGKTGGSGGSIGGKTRSSGGSIGGNTAGSENSGSNGSSDCIIVNVLNAKDQLVYIQELRQWRDKVLTKNIIGRAAIRVYYKISPKLVKVSKKMPIINIPIKKTAVFIANIV